MNVLVVSGIWPPDVGGPASHAPELSRWLTEHGHTVRVVVTADAQPRPEAYAVAWVSRQKPKVVLHAEVVRTIAHEARRADVVYATGMFTRAMLAAALVRRPVVLKLTGDPAFERARWRGRVAGDVGAFQRGGGGFEAGVLRHVRDITVRRAAALAVPSAYLGELAVSWGASPKRVEVVPNASPPLPALAAREELRQSFGFDGPTVVFAGRFGPQKALDSLVTAAHAAGVALVLAGDGQGRADLEALVRTLEARVDFVGPVARTRVLELFAAADAAVLASSWENFPHGLVEALAVGTPVIATRVGGVAEIVEDGVNGLLVPPGDVDAFTGALRRYFDDESLQRSLRASARDSVERFAPDVVYERLARVIGRAGGAA